MKTTDKFYEIKNDDVHFNASRIIDALNECSEKHYLTMEDINALARLLTYKATLKGNYHEEYEHAIDYLWMSFHIEQNHKMCLLDLVDEI